jgi:hypothetical protein
MSIKITYNGTVLIEQIDQPKPEPDQVGVWMSMKCEGITVRAKGPNMSYKLPNDKVANLSVQYVDSKGNPADVDGDVVWSSSNEEVCGVEVNDSDSKVARLVPGDQVGQVQITATADADMGEGVRNISCFIDVEVIAGEAVAGVISPIGPAQLPT